MLEQLTSNSIAQKLSAFGLPLDYPVAATFLSKRPKSFASEHHLLTVAELCAHPLVIASPKRTGVKNFSTASLREIQDLARSITTADVAALRRFVPVRQLGGIDLAFGARRALGEKAWRRVVGRFLTPQTLEDAGANQEDPVTKEMVRLDQVALFKFLSELLAADVLLREKLMNEWRATGSVTRVPSDESPEAVTTVSNALALQFTEEAYGKYNRSWRQIVDAEPNSAEAISAKHELDVIDELVDNPTERENVYLSRIGQGKFRADLIRNRKCCHVTGLDDARFLRASHIKRWCDSNNRERLDWHNGLLLSPNIDLLFELALITFEDDGVLRISTLLPASIRKLFGLDQAKAKTPFSNETKGYLLHHRQRFDRLLERAEGHAP